MGHKLTSAQRTIYQQLWKVGDAGAVNVHYLSRELTTTPSLAGWFHPEPPQIRIFHDGPSRPNHADPENADLAELITLAHELGHWQSWRDRKQMNRDGKPGRFLAL